MRTAEVIGLACMLDLSLGGGRVHGHSANRVTLGDLCEIDIFGHGNSFFRRVEPEPSFSIVGADALVSPYTPIYSWERFNWCMAGAPSSWLFLLHLAGRHLEETNSRAPTQAPGG